MTAKRIKAKGKSKPAPKRTIDEKALRNVAGGARYKVANKAADAVDAYIRS